MPPRPVTQSVAAKWAPALIALLVAIGAITITGDGGGPPTTTTTTSTTSTTAGTTTTVPGYTSYTSFCGTTSPDSPRVLEVPADQIATSPDSAKWAARIFAYADQIDDFSPDLASGVGASAGGDYSITVYCADDATTTNRIYLRPGFGSFRGVLRGGQIPWNPAWKAPDGNDGWLLIVDPATGKEYDIWAVSSPQYQPSSLPQSACQGDLNNLYPVGPFTPNGLPAGTPAYDPGAHLCAGAISVITTPSGTVADFRSYRGNYPWGGGVGLPNTVGLTTPDEVATGTIHHALKFFVGKQAMLGGPLCTSNTYNNPLLGESCGTAVAPAGQFEGVNSSKTPTPCDVVYASDSCIAGMIPEGTRFVLDISDDDIAAWITSHSWTGTTATTMTTFAHALRDYGLILSSTSGGQAMVQVAGDNNADTAAGWASLALPSSGTGVFGGLVTSASQIRVLDPPTNVCGTGGDKRTYCHASDIHY